MSKWIISVLMCSGLFVACTVSGSGVSSSLPVDLLSDDEIFDLCDYTTDVVGPQVTISCGGGRSVTIGDASIDDCIEDFEDLRIDGCDATVFDAELCAEDIAASTDDELCAGIPLSCDPLFDCFL